MMVDERYQTMLLFGAPGVGKGTQGRILANIPGFFHMSCGDVFRSIDIHSPEGKLVYETTSRGDFVPDELTIKIWKKAMEGKRATSQFKPHEDILVLDGLPRNVRQVELASDHLNIARIIHLVCSNEEAMIHRIRRRAIRDNRVDDASEAIIRHRMQVYHEQTQPVLDCFSPSLICQVDALGSPAEVLATVLSHIIPVQNEHFQRLGRSF
jgi:adenylate kinase